MRSKQVAGAFGKVYHQEHERDEKEAFRDHLIGVVSENWSYSEIRAFGEQQERDYERAQEIADMFAELQGQSLEEACFAAYLRSYKDSRENMRLNHARRVELARRFRARYRSDPEFRAAWRERCRKIYHSDAEYRAACIANSRRHYQETRADPSAWSAYLEKDRARRKRARKADPEGARAKQREYRRRWLAKLKREDPARLEELRERWRRSNKQWRDQQGGAA